MIKNYLKSAWRSILKDRLAAFINIFGLVAGLCGALVLGLYTTYELNYDAHFKNKDKIYRVISSFDEDGKAYVSAQSYAGIGPLLVRLFPEVQKSTRLLAKDEAFLFRGKEAFKEGIIYTDTSFLGVFDLTLLSGNKITCLSAPSSAIISQRLAIKLFGNNWQQINVPGKLLRVDDRIPLTITAVFADLPAHSHFSSDIFATIPSDLLRWMSDENKVYTYVVLGSNTNAYNFAEKLKSVQDHFAITQDEKHMRISLQPLTKIHLFSSYKDENATVGDIRNVYAFLLVAGLLIIISISNFVNLYLAVSNNRLREIGVRKAVGALSGQIRLQFLSETILITFIAVFISLMLLVICLPALNNVTGLHLIAENILHPYMMSFIGGIIVVVGISAGIYPAFYLSGTKPSKALKGSGQIISSIKMRKILVTLQFSVSYILVFISIVAFRQIHYINNRPLGFDKENTVAIANPYMLGSPEKITTLKNELLKAVGVAQVSITGYSPSQTHWVNSKLTFSGKNEHRSAGYPANWIIGDENFIQTMGLSLFNGRNFFQSSESDKGAIIINETAASQFGLNVNGKGAVGQQLSFKDSSGAMYQTYTVIGVVRDFNYGSLHEMITPLVIKRGYHRFELIVKLSGNYSRSTIMKEVAAIWKQHVPGIPFEYTFIKERFNNLHNTDNITSHLFSIFCFLTIILSASGMFSIVIYSITFRKKEIGIRKTLGASVFNIAAMIIKEFMRLVLVSFLVGLPVAWFFAYKWLEGFVFRIDIPWYNSLFAGLTIGAIAALTLGFQSIKAGMINPVDNLRNH